MDLCLSWNAKKNRSAQVHVHIHLRIKAQFFFLSGGRGVRQKQARRPLPTEAFLLETGRPGGSSAALRCCPVQNLIKLILIYHRLVLRSSRFNVIIKQQHLVRPF